VAGHAELADDENVERAGDLGRNRDATTGNAEHYDVGAVSEVAEFGGEQAARFGTVAKTPLGGEWSRPGSDRVEKMRGEPARRQSRDFVEGSRLLEKMRGSGNHLEARHPRQPLHCVTVERENELIVTPDAVPPRPSAVAMFEVRVAATEPAPPTIGTYPTETAVDAAGKLRIVTVGCDHVLAHLDAVDRPVFLQLPHV